MAKALEAMLELRGILREGDEENPDVRLCFYGEPRLLVVGDEELREYELALGRLWRADTEVHQTVGRKTLESELLRVLRQTANDSRELQRQDADLMMANLKKSPVQGFFVLRRIEGVAFKGMEPCAAGSCQIIELPRDLQSTPRTTDYILREDMRKLDGVFVQYEVAAREPQRATELADEVFGKLEGLLRVAAGVWHESAQIRILDEVGQWRREAIAIGRQGVVGKKYEQSPYVHDIWIDEVVKSIESNHPGKYWPLVDSSQLSDLEKRALRGILWLGKAYSSQRTEDAFLQCAIALEVALVMNQRDVITPSILYQLAESVAVLLGRNQRERLQIDEEMRKFYGKRSAIVHKGSDEVSREDCERFLSYARNCLIFLLGDDTYRQLGSLDAIHRHMKEFKFGDRQ
ncbi:MAG: hypothetical protein F4049_04585 [Gemmatimonadetes bacterium]|nr:hypothetical protein [Rhodothermaceae bacterium]MYK39477.1 hypothetical protein [Gemmatimonadota bacterium]